MKCLHIFGQGYDWYRVHDVFDNFEVLVHEKDHFVVIYAPKWNDYYCTFESLADYYEFMHQAIVGFSNDLKRVNRHLMDDMGR